MLDFIPSFTLADILLIFATIGAAVYCFILARRLRKLQGMETGMGGAIAVLSDQIEGLTDILQKAETSASNSTNQLQTLTEKSEAGAAKLEVLLAALHDLPDPDADQHRDSATFVRSEMSVATQEAAE